MGREYPPLSNVGSDDNASIKLQEQRKNLHGRGPNFSRFQVEAAGANPEKSGTARAVCDDRLPRSFGGTHTPQIKLDDWTLALPLGGSLLNKCNWAEFDARPQTTIKTDTHCVTKWSKLDTTRQEVTFDDLLTAMSLAEPPAPCIMAHCEGAYTTNMV
jgi:DMSO/TMAO reductase YedYZ molybdopterin-dependent catalytic subunit